jgi:hypothetical protein
VSASIRRAGSRSQDVEDPAKLVIVVILSYKDTNIGQILVNKHIKLLTLFYVDTYSTKDKTLRTFPRFLILYSIRDKRAAAGETKAFPRNPPMSLIYPNIVPENNLRLPDALTIKHGPAPLLSRFVLEGDKAVREKGIRLRLRHDFEELVYVNKQQTSRGNWFRLVNMFNPQYSDLTPENSYWISGEDDRGEIAVTQAGRVYYWPESTLEHEARLMFYGGRDEGQRCIVAAEDAKLIRGVVFYGGSVWVRPDFRGRRLSELLPRLGRAYALARWPVDWGISFVAPTLVEKGIAAGYGYKHSSYSITFPASPWGELEVVLVSLSAAEAYEDLTEALTKLSDITGVSGSTASSTNLLDDSVTNTSSDGVFQGSSNRS